MTKFLILDIDGVLNCGDQKGLLSPQCEQLKRVLDETGALVILSSERRKSSESLKQIIKLILEMNHTMQSVTPVRPNIFTRAEEIKLWITLNCPARYVILDDDKSCIEMFPYHTVLTDQNIGLTEELANKVIEKLNG